ncbi:RNA-binding domain-containing protein [Trichodelitschia bisporula]|uniref:RNA-binding domain-containing protein n=1 Tax=Trichodelitschia bisporula TaxID=703511 RepID=A0A6G1I2F7_9PEZI|nr:RNA-binding domain-containing protein [Trichodelitschia bisporula]
MASGNPTHPSLPARPPPSANAQPAFKPAFAAPSATRPQAGFSGATAFRPRSVAAPAPTPAQAQNWQQPYSQPISGAVTPATSYQQTSYYPQQQPQQPQPSTSYYQQSSYETYNQPTPPQITNPFVPPDRNGKFSNDAYDPEYEAQIAQWQSAYTGREDSGSKSTKAPPSAANTAPAGREQPSHNETAGTALSGAEPTVVRSGGGKQWQDPSLLEWDPSHPRLFIGNLAGEVTDESLLKAFSRYPSVSRARVIREKRTTKSKGYGFVSFANSDDYFQAAKEMQGKYIGSHPILIKRSTTNIAPTTHQQQKKHGKGGGKKGPGAGTNSGIQKKQSKTKNGLKLLG